MADNSTIDRYADLWAQERTLIKLLNEAGSTNRILLQYMKSSMTKDQIDAIQKQTSEINSGLSGVRQQIKSEYDDFIPIYRSEELKTRSSILSNSKSISESLSAMKNSLNISSISSIFNTASSYFKHRSIDLEDTIAHLSKGFAIVGEVAGLFEFAHTQIDNLNEAFIESYASGVRFSGGLDGLNEAVGASGLSLRDFTGIINRHSQTFAILGGKRLVELNKGFKELTHNGSDLAMTQSESQDAFMTYLDIQRQSGMLQKQTSASLVAGGKTFLSSINDLAQMSGKSRDELLKQTRDVVAQPAFQAFMATLNDGARANLQQSITSLGVFGSDIQKEFTDLIVSQSTGGVAAMMANNKNLYMLAAQTGQLPKLMNIIELAKAGQDTTAAMREFQSGIKDSNLVQSGQLTRMAQFNPLAAGMNDELGKLTIAIANTKSQAELEKDAREQGYKSVAEMQEAELKKSKEILDTNAKVATAMTGFHSALDRLLLEVVLPVLIPTMNTMADVLSGVTTALSKFGDVLGGINKFVSGIFGNGSFGKFAGGAASIAAGYGGYKVAKYAGGALMQGIGGMAPNLLGMLGPKLPNIPFLGPMAKTLGGMARGAGGIISGVMEGIAKGFKAFGDPKVLLGIVGVAGVAASMWVAAKAFQQFATVSWEEMAKAGVAIVGLGVAAGAAGFAAPEIAAGGIALGTAIAAIGAAIAGASWLMGNTLPTLANGLTIMSQLDGAKLSAVGSGMTGLSLGLLSMGAGDFVNALSGLASGILNFFSGNDPITRLTRFGELAEPLTKSNKAMSEFSTTFKSAMDVINNAKLDNGAFDSITKMLGSDFGGMFGGNPAIIGQINSLADSIKHLNKNTSDFISTTDKSTVSSDIQKRTLSFYDNQRESNASIINLLNMAITKLDDINSTTSDGHSSTVAAIKRSGQLF